MTEKQLTEGQNLIEKIKKLEKRIEIWNKSTRIHQLALSLIQVKDIVVKVKLMKTTMFPLI